MTLATAVVLALSLVVSVLANRRFNRLADEGRSQWRGHLYAFLAEAEWERLVEGPIREGRRAYQGALPFIAVLYAAAVSYLLVLSIPSPAPPPEADMATASRTMPTYRVPRVPYRMPGSEPRP